jgi:hypothetical protein
MTRWCEKVGDPSTSGSRGSRINHQTQETLIMTRSSRLRRVGSLTAAAALALAVVGPVSADSHAPLTAVVAVDDTGSPEAGQSWVRVLHASPDAPAVDVKVDDADVLTNVAFGTISDYLPVPAGTYNIKVCAAGTATCVIDADLTFADGARYTVAATNELASIEAQVLEDTVAPVAGQAQVRVVHFSADTPAVDVLTQDGSATIVDNLAYPNATGYLSLAPGSYDLKVCANADNTVCPLDPGALDLAADTAYSVFAIGSLAALSDGGDGDGGDGDAEVTPPPTDTVGTTGAATGSSTPAFLLIGVLAAAFVGGLRLATVRARR